MDSNASNATIYQSIAEEKIHDALDCYYWHLEKNLTYGEANDLCFVYGNPFSGATVHSACMGILGSLIVLSNLIVLWGIIGTKKLRKAMYYYIANLAIADVVVGFVCLYIPTRHHAPSLWERLCLRTFIALATALSTSALTLLSIDRYVSVIHPVVYHNKVSGRQACVVILTSWIVIIIVTFSSLMGWNCLEKGYAFSGRCAGYLTLGYIIFVVTILLLLVCVTLWANIHIYRAIKRLVNRNPGGRQLAASRRDVSVSAMDNDPQPGPSKRPDDPLTLGGSLAGELGRGLSASPVDNEPQPGPSKRPDVPLTLDGSLAGELRSNASSSPFDDDPQPGPYNPSALGGPRAAGLRRDASSSAVSIDPQPGPSNRPDVLSTPLPPPNSQYKIQKARAVTTVVFAAFVSWLLYFVFLGAHRICEAYRSSCPIRGIATWGLLIAFLNSLVNPLVHGLRVPALKIAVLAKFNTVREAVAAVFRRNRVDSGNQDGRDDDKGPTSVGHSSRHAGHRVEVSVEIRTPTPNCEDQGKTQQSADGQHLRVPGRPRTLALE